MKLSKFVNVIHRKLWTLSGHGVKQTVVRNNHGQHEYFLIYSFELKAAFGVRQLFTIGS